jgi:hypothetical protein
MLAACPWCVPLRASLQMSGMYQMSFLEAASSSTGALDAALELAEPLLARHQVGAAGLEHLPALGFEAARQQPQERRLAHAVVAADEQRARRASAGRPSRRRQDLAPQPRLDQQLQLLALRPEAAERGEEGAIDAGALEGVELPDQCAGERMVHLLQEGANLRRREA